MPGFGYVAALLLGFVPLLWAQSLARPRGPDRPSISSSTRGSGDRWRRFPWADRRRPRAERNWSDAGRGIRPSLRLALRPLPRDMTMAKGIGRDRCRLDQHAGRLVALRAGSLWIPIDRVAVRLCTVIVMLLSLLITGACSTSEDMRRRSASGGGSPPSAGSSPVTIGPSVRPLWPVLARRRCVMVAGTRRVPGADASAR